MRPEFLYALLGGALGYMTGGRAKAAKKRKAMMYAAAGYAAFTFGPKYGINLPRLG